MAKQYSVQFFTSFVESLQEVCRKYLDYNQFVEVSGYVCVEIDNVKKERYVLSELLHSSGNVISESYCTKAYKTAANTRVPQPPVHSMGCQPHSIDVDRRKEFNDQSKSLVEHALCFTPSSKTKRKSSDTELEDPEYMRSVPKRTAFSTDIEQQQNMPSSSTVSAQSFSSDISSDSINQSQANTIQEKKITFPQHFPQPTSTRVSHLDQSGKGSPGLDRHETQSSDIRPKEEVKLKGLDQFDEEDLGLQDVLEEDNSSGASEDMDTIPVLRLQGRHFPRKILPVGVKQNITRTCAVCSPAMRKMQKPNTTPSEKQGKKKKKRFGHESSYECNVCETALCIEPCFRLYHSTNDYLSAYLTAKYVASPECTNT